MRLHNFSGSITQDILLRELTTWRIGGPADWVIQPRNHADLASFFRWISTESTPWLVLGNGSNILFSDEGFRGVIVILGDGFKDIHIDGCRIRAGAGTRLSMLANRAAEAGLSGLEPLAGIPGTVGGAAFVNAGAFGSSFLDLCEKVTGLDGQGLDSIFDATHSGYRSGGFPDGCVITDLQLSLVSGNPSRIHELMHQYLERRWSTQPLSNASAGCTFKNPAGTGAGRLIDGLGLKGFQIGQAMISTQHANFIINSGAATAVDVMEVIRHVRGRVFEASGIKLELEVLVLDEHGVRQDPGGIFE